MKTIDLIKNYPKEIQAIAEASGILSILTRDMPNAELSGIGRKYCAQFIVDCLCNNDKDVPRYYPYNYLKKCELIDFKYVLKKVSFYLMDNDKSEQVKEIILMGLLANPQVDKATLLSFTKVYTVSANRLPLYIKESSEHVLKMCSLLPGVDPKDWLLAVTVEKPIEEQEKIFDVYKKYFATTESIRDIRMSQIEYALRQRESHYIGSASSFINIHVELLQHLKALHYPVLPDEILKLLREKNHLYTTIAADIAAPQKRFHTYLKILFIDHVYISNKYCGKIIEDYKTFKENFVLNFGQKLTESYKSRVSPLKMPVERTEKSVLNQQLKSAKDTPKFKL